jgi:hypothetical protein
LAPDPYIRFRDTDDMGLRPPDANLFTTPAISILKPTGMGLDPDPAIAHADVAQLVHVEVGNKGADEADATVTVWAFGFGTASGYSGSLGGITGRSAPVTIPAGSSGSSTAVNINWTPQAAEIGGAQRHFCIRANVFVDPNDQEPDPNGPAGTPPAIDIFGNVRHAQRNMTLLPMPMMLKAPMNFDLAIANLDEEKDDLFRFDVREVRGEFEPNEIAHLRQTRWIDREFEKGLLLPGTGGEVEVTAARRPAGEFALQLGEQSGRRLETQLKAGEEGAITLQMTLEPGEEASVHRFDVFQHGREGLVGAARVMTIAVPEDLLERTYESASD